MPENGFYKQIIDALPIGYAYHDVMYDEKGEFSDFRVIEVNKAFETMTGLKRSRVLGHPISTVLTGFFHRDYDWKRFYEKILSGTYEENIYFPLGRPKKLIKINAFSPKVDKFVALFTDATALQRETENVIALASISEKLLNYTNDAKNWETISKYVLSASHAKFVAFNLYDEDGKQYQTQALVGNRNLITKAMGIHGMKVEGKKWDHDFIRAEKIKDGVITRFPTLHDLSGDVVPKSVCALLTKILGLGETIVIKIMKDDVMLGDFTLFMPKSQSLEQDAALKIFSRQLGVVIERERSKEKLTRAYRRYESLIANIPGIAYRCTFDGEWRTLFISDYAFALTGYAAENFIGNTGHSFKSIIHPDDVDRVDGNIAQAVRDNRPWDLKYRIDHRDGRTRWVHERGSGVHDDKGSVVYLQGVIFDVTERKKNEDEIEYLVTHDHLTGLYNRKSFDDALKRFDNEKELPLTVVKADVNGLKLINDTFGHAVGDKLLIIVADTLKESFDDDTIISRRGGDEFAVLLPRTTAKEAARFIERIHERLKTKRINEMAISVAFGAETRRNMSAPVSALLKKAEDLMYHNKMITGQSIRTQFIDNTLSFLYAKNPREYDHSQRVSRLCMAIGKALNLDERALEQLRVLGLLHDIGKISVTDEILDKPASLTKEETKEMQLHVEVGYRIVRISNKMSEIANHLLAHHERWDGTGYPTGLAGEDIPLHSRICAIADAYDAMTSDRPHRGKLQKAKAVEELREHSGTQFDPTLAEVFLNRVLPGLERNDRKELN